jgi:predicted amidohydrolase
MGGEDRAKIERTSGRDDLLIVDALRLQPGHRLREPPIATERRRVQVVDAMHLFGRIGQVEVDGERPHQMDGVDHVNVFEDLGELNGRRRVTPQLTGDGSHAFDPIEEVGALLANERVAELISEPPDIGSQRRVDRLEIRVGRHDSPHCSTAAPQAQDIEPTRQPTLSSTMTKTSLIPERYASFETTATIGVVNFSSIRGDVAATLAKVEANIREAGAQGVDILVFPEEALSGLGGCDACRHGTDHCDYHHGLAETVPGPSTERIAELCAEHDLYVAVGMVERDADDPDVLYNAAAFIGPEGIQGTYRKLHLGSLPWVTEGVTFTPGDRLPVFETRFGPVGIQICYDFWFNPELTRLLALKGARVILNCCGTFAGPGKLDYMTQTTSTRAQENLCYVASANHVGGEKSADSYSAAKVDEGRAADMLGHSTIAGPAFPRFSQVLAQAGDTEEMVSATISFEKLHRWEPIFPWRDWRATHQLPISQLIADEFALLAKGEGPE